MAKIKVWDWSLRKSLIFYVLDFALLALLLAVLTSTLCQQAKDSIWATYPPEGEKYYLVNIRGERLGGGAYIGVQPTELEPRDQRLITALDVVQQACAPFYAAVCIIAAALLFYRRKLKRPLAELSRATEKIAANDLDFALEYAAADELGQLCAAFETMRARLAGNFAEMWELAEERRRLNAAFAHDLRTPLTVLKGYNEMLQAAADPQTCATAATMSRQIARLEKYVESMSHLQRLEQLQPARQELSAAESERLLAGLAESARIICAQRGKELLTVRIEEADPAALAAWRLDGELVSRVGNNLIDNAARYAQSRVWLNFAVQEGGLLLTVADDGPGFSAAALSRAAEPYFSGEADRAEHFGLGLYICKLLCQRHGGYLQTLNRPEGGGEARAFFRF